VTCGRSVVFSGFFTNKTDRHEITEILFNVALNIRTLTLIYCMVFRFTSVYASNQYLEKKLMVFFEGTSVSSFNKTELKYYKNIVKIVLKPNYIRIINIIAS
jgi:hypothetical protein